MILWRRPTEVCGKCEYNVCLWREECGYADCEQPAHGESQRAVVQADVAVFAGLLIVLSAARWLWHR
jgi:hypothetical protein